ncbi:MAG: hypothetical protein IPH95_10120 [Candidatus Promineofilum sp.]|nr:hypothetical protein [Promineifilum sp.]
MVNRADSGLRLADRRGVFRTARAATPMAARGQGQANIDGACRLGNKAASTCWTARPPIPACLGPVRALPGWSPDRAAVVQVLSAGRADDRHPGVVTL